MDGLYEEVLNSDASEFGGSGRSIGQVRSQSVAAHNRQSSIVITLPPLAAVVLERRSA